MHRRPDSVLIICIMCMILGGISLVAMLVTISGGSDMLPMWIGSDQRDKMNVLQAVGLVDALTAFFCGIFMLQGANWARWLFAIEAAVGSAVLAFLSPDNLPIMVTTLGIRVICIVFLFLPASSKFFISRSRIRRL